MPEETATAEAPPQEPPAPVPAPEAAPAPSAEAAPAFTSEAAPETSETPSAEPVAEPTVEPPPWAQLTEASEVLGHESFAEPLAERDQATYNRVKDQMQPLLQQQSAALTNIDQSMKAMRTNVEDMVEEGILDEKAARRLRAEAPELFKDLNLHHQTIGRNAGKEDAITVLLQQAGASMPALTGRLENALTKGNPDPTLVDDVLSALTSAAVTKAREKWVKDEQALVGKNVRAEAQDAARKAANPDPVAEPTGGAGGGGGGTSWRTKMEARGLHVQNKITNTEMKRINADPTIPEM